MVLLVVLPIVLTATGQGQGLAEIWLFLLSALAMLVFGAALFVVFVWSALRPWFEPPKPPTRRQRRREANAVRQLFEEAAQLQVESAALARRAEEFEALADERLATALPMTHRDSWITSRTDRS